jgi:transcription-repair coupling factor (superfamily II helicase)
MSSSAVRRLSVFKDSSFGSVGLNIALKDLEIRGAGNLLGKEQSGHVTALGFDVYLEVLREVAETMRGRREELEFEPKVETYLPVYIPSYFVPDYSMRFELYRKLALASSEDEIDSICEDVRRMFGELPGEFLNLIYVMKIKMLARRLGISAVRFSDLYFDLVFLRGNPERVLIRDLDNPLSDAMEYLKNFL